MFIWCDNLLLFLHSLQGVPIEAHPSKLVGSSGSKTRYFDFEKLAEACFLCFDLILMHQSKFSFACLNRSLP